MGIWGFVLHLGNFVLPALVVAALLSPGVLGRGGLTPPGAGLRRLLRTWALLAAAGLAVLAAGLAWFGRDGKMATYAVLVLAVGSLAWWLQRRHLPPAGAGRRGKDRPAR
ncbi:MAG: hypothetical protein RJA36_380 [Pseudomonadota bacterium]|jgi:hypothetical protein